MLFRSPKAPLLSIIIPAYNEARNLPMLSDRLTPCLVEITEEFEVIIINDGSADETAAQIAEQKESDLQGYRKGELTNMQTLAFAGALCVAGSAVLWFWVNPLTMWLTFATFVGYAVVYTVVLKPLTPQNIVIGGASGAMPPLLGWAAMTNDVGPEALMLVLIIFLWTPPHFWALALYRAEDYRRSGLPMLPITHGPEFTRLQVLLYTLVLFAATLLPFTYRMSGWIYLGAAVVLGGRFIQLAWQLWRDYSDALARRTFRLDRKSTRLNSSHIPLSRMPSSA